MANPNMVKGAPSVNPSGRAGKQERTDGVFNPFTGHGTADDRRTYTRHRTHPVQDYQAIDMRRGNWLAKRICELLPSECFRKGYTLKLDDKETAEDVCSVAEDLHVNQRLIEAGAMERAAGGAALFPVLRGALGDLSQPLDLEKPRILSVKAIHLLEPRELHPVQWYSDIESEKWRTPSHYRLMALSSGGTFMPTSTIIHESRLVVFPGVRVSVETMFGQRTGWGDSVLTPSEEVINDFGLAWGSAMTILHNFSERVQAIEGFEKIIAHKDGAATLIANLRKLDMLRSTLRTRVVSASANVTESSKSVAGMAELLIQSAQIISASSDIPSTRLFGMSPAGLNATGEYDQDGWHDRVGNEQMYKYTSRAERLLRLIMLSSDGPTGGNEPDVWSLEWNPLKQQNPEQIATTRKTVAETDQIYLDMGVPALSIIKARFGGDTYSSELQVDIAEVEAQIAEKEAAAAEQARMIGGGAGPDGNSAESGTAPIPGDEPAT